MLNGIAPIFIFTFSPTLNFSDSLKGIPLISSFVENVGIPIPIYLDEKLTGVYVTHEEKSIDIDNDIIASSKGSSVYQRPLESMVTINLVAKKDSIALTALLALCDIIFSKLKYGYGISYLNGPTTIFGGMLKTFATTTSPEDDLVRISIQLSKAKGSSTDTTNAVKAKESAATLEATPGITTQGTTNGGGITVPASAPGPA